MTVHFSRGITVTVHFFSRSAAALLPFRLPLRHPERAGSQYKEPPWRALPVRYFRESHIT